MPACAEATKPAKAQHSRTELPFDAEIAVRFSAGGTGAEDNEDGVVAVDEDVVEAAAAAPIAASSVKKVDVCFMIDLLFGLIGRC